MKKRILALIAVLLVGFTATYAKATLVSFDPYYAPNGKMTIYVQVANASDYPLPVNYSYTDAAGQTQNGDIVMQNGVDSIVCEMAPGQYTFNIDINHGDDVREFPLTAATPTGVEDIKTAMASLKVIKSPGNDVLTISASNVLLGSSVILYNSIGQPMKTDKLTESGQAIEVKDLAGGMYFVTVYNQSKSTTRRIIL